MQAYHSKSYAYIELHHAPLPCWPPLPLKVSFEQPATNDESEYIPMDSRPEPVVVIKAVVCGIAATVCGVPVILLTSTPSSLPMHYTIYQVMPT